MYDPETYEEYLNDIYDSYIDRVHEITGKEILSDEDIEELKKLITHIDSDKDRRYINRR